jgi:hypothetical protein
MTQKVDFPVDLVLYKGGTQSCRMMRGKQMRDCNISNMLKVKGKGKVVCVLFLTEHHAMKAYWGADV